MSLTYVMIWLAVGWLGACLIWFDATNRTFRGGWRLALFCFAMILAGPLSILLGAFFVLATSLDRKERWATWLVQKRAR